MTSILIMLHVLAAVIWVGGMFFAHFVLRQAAGAMADQDRLALWGRVFGNFFPWVWASIAVLLVTGYMMVSTTFGGFGALTLYLKLMNGLGILMVLIYLHLWFAPYKRFRRALESGDPTTAAKPLGQIRLMVTINLFIGLVVVMIGASGRYWG
jgi:uncharacterized membrane protein